MRGPESSLTMRVVPPGGGEVVGDSPDRRVEILTDRDGLHATWSRFAAGRAGADLHVHHHHTDLFYVLAGELTVMLGDGEVVVPAGSLACVPPLVVHGFKNASDGEVRYLNLHAPGVGFAEFMRGLRDGRTVTYDQHDPPPDGGRSPGEATIGPPPLVTDAIAITENGPLADALYVFDGTWIDDPQERPDARYLSIRL